MSKDKDSVDSTVDALLRQLIVSDHTNWILAGVALLFVLVGVVIGKIT